jgi:hypothetical protein
MGTPVPAQWKAAPESCHPIMATGRYPADQGRVNTFAAASGNEAS